MPLASWRGVCPHMDTWVQVGPTGKKLLPLKVKNAGQAPASSGHAHCVSEALDRVIEALAGASEDEVAAALTAAGAVRPRPPATQAVPRTPLPDSGGPPQIVSGVEWA
jgi:hypothetical protein